MFVQSRRRERLPAAIVAIAVPVLLGYVLIAGLAVPMPPAIIDRLEVFGITAPRPEPAPPPPAPVQREAAPREEGEAAPPNRTAEPTEVVAPPPVVVIPLPPPVVVAPIAGSGTKAEAGAAELPGPGTGAGGVGNGRGSGGRGDGPGGGGGAETPPRWIRGGISDRDYPRGVGEAGVSGRVSVAYLVDVDGRVRTCEIEASSGSRILDATTCDLIQRRFRFRPSRDGSGRPVPAWIVEDHYWEVKDVYEPQR